MRRKSQSRRKPELSWFVCGAGAAPLAPVRAAHTRHEGPPWTCHRRRAGVCRAKMSITDRAIGERLTRCVESIRPGCGRPDAVGGGVAQPRPLMGRIGEKTSPQRPACAGGCLNLHSFARRSRSACGKTDSLGLAVNTRPRGGSESAGMVALLPLKSLLSGVIVKSAAFRELQPL
jgi:hypothetical protein